MKLSYRNKKSEFPPLKKGDIVVRGPDWSWGKQDAIRIPNGEWHQCEGICNGTSGRGEWISVTWFYNKEPVGINSYIYCDDKHDIILKEREVEYVQEEMEL